MIHAEKGLWYLGLVFQTVVARLNLHNGKEREIGEVRNGINFHVCGINIIIIAYINKIVNYRHQEDDKNIPCTLLILKTDI